MGLGRGGQTACKELIPLFTDSTTVLCQRQDENGQKLQLPQTRRPEVIFQTRFFKRRKPGSQLRRNILSHSQSVF
jgi:hypothetical protein